MLGQPQPLLEAAKLAERVPAEGAVDLHGDEGVRARRAATRRWDRAGFASGEKQHLEGVRVRAKRLADGLAGGPVRGAPVGADEVFGRSDEALRPGEGKREDAAVVVVGVGVGEAPGARSDRRFEDDARPQRLPRVGASVREEDLAHSTGRELTPRVADDAHADDGHVEVVAVHLRHAPDGPLRHAALADEAVDAGDDLGSVWQRDGSRVELLEVAQAQVHPISQTTSSGSL